jgi:hydroxypyruvate reductase
MAAAAKRGKQGLKAGAPAAHARRVFRVAVQSASPLEAVKRHLLLETATGQQPVLRLGGRTLSLKEVDRIWVVGAGKASAPMALAAERLLGRRVSGGAVVVKYGHGSAVKRVSLFEAGHPVPDDAGVAGAAAVAAIADEARSGDLVLAMISGGASALLVSPAEGVTLRHKQECTRLLLACGANIHEMNAVRKHLSALKGGQLARRAAPARVWALLLSDVIGDDLDVIGSGPCAPDASTFEDAIAVLRRYAVWDRVPKPVRDRLQAGVEGRRPETPKAGDRLFQKVSNVVVGSNAQAIQAAADEAARLGYRPLVLTTTLDGEAREQARMLVAIAREAQASGRPAKAPLCILAGGETTVTLRGQGKGGRNQEFALAAALALEGTRGITLLAAGTDGTDGPTDAAGAVVDGDTLGRARKRGFDPAAVLAENDSYPLFQATAEAVMTGPTGTNVMDVYAALVLPR